MFFVYSNQSLKVSFPEEVISALKYVCLLPTLLILLHTTVR
jgi:hypothetical protein